MSTQHPHPWYVSNKDVERWKLRGKNGANLKMSKIRAWLRAIVVNLGIISITLYGIQQGADPTIIGTIGLGSLGMYNGLELSDYAALLRAIGELGSEVDSQSGND